MATPVMESASADAAGCGGDQRHLVLEAHISNQ
jgi:hypothetical protein